MFHKVLLLCMAGAAAALPQFYTAPYQHTVYSPPRQQPPYIPVYQEQDDNEEGMPYQFHYAVQDAHVGAYYQHYANSDGDNVEGSYTVQLPDGRKQKVTYTADPDEGYKAEVTYEGEAQHPQVYGSPVTYYPGNVSPHYGYYN